MSDSEVELMADVEEGSSMPSPGSKLCTGKMKSKCPELGRINGAALPRDDSPIDALSSTQKDDVLRKLYLHLLPKFFILTVLCYVDRTNLAFAALTMNDDINITSFEYGLGSGLFFFLGYIISQAGLTTQATAWLFYCLLSLQQVPSNLALHRVGARRWLSFLVIAWGIIASLFATLKNVKQFYVLRFFLGCAEGGTMPGMWYTLSLFFSEGELTVAWGWVLVGTALSQVIGAPIAAGLLEMEGVGHLHGWQWLFLVEGLLTILMGVYLAMALASNPSKAYFLAPNERTWLHKRQSEAVAEAAKSGSGTVSLAAIKDLRTWHLSAISLLANIPKWGIVFFCPLIIDYMLGGAKDKAIVALLTAVPFGIAAAVILGNAYHSKATNERRWHVAVPLAFAACALFALSFLLKHHKMRAAFGTLMVAAVVWAPDAVVAIWPATFLQGPGAATGIALINTIGSFGGMAGPLIIGAVRGAGGGYFVSMLVLAAASLTTSLLSACFREPKKLKRRVSGELTEPAC